MDGPSATSSRSPSATTVERAACSHAAGDSRRCHSRTPEPTARAESNGPRCSFSGPASTVFHPCVRNTTSSPGRIGSPGVVSSKWPFQSMKSRPLLTIGNSRRVEK